MNEPVPIDKRQTIPPSTEPPAGWPDVAQEVVRQAGPAYERYQDRSSDRPPRPRASTLSVVLMVLVGVGYALGLAAFLGHQWGTLDYERRQEERHKQLLIGIYGLIDVIAVHHPEARQIEQDMQRAKVRP